MKKLINIAIGLILILSCGCDDLLDAEVKTDLEADKNYQTAKDVSTNVLGIFASVQDVMHKVAVFNDLRSDALVVTENAPIDLVTISRYIEDVNNPIINPNDFYRIIVNCNDFVANAAKYRESGDYMSDEQFEAHMADVLRIKYWTYWNIAKIYGKAYYFDDPLDNTEDIDAIKKLAATPLAEMIELLITKIESSEYDLLAKVDWQNLFESNANYNYYSIDAEILLADLYLWKQDYVKATQLYHRILNDRTDWDLTLTGETYYKGNYKKLFSNNLSATNGHVISAVEYDETNQQLCQLEQYFYKNGIIQLKASDALVNLSLDQESEDNKNGDYYRGALSSYKGSDRRVMKYSFASKARVPLYRAAELHLKYAEALNQLGEFDKALALLNKGVGEYWDGKKYLPPFDDDTWEVKWKNGKGLRGRVKLAAKELEDGLTDDEKKDVIEQWILDESALELAFEGKRFENLMRHALRHNDASILANAVAEKFEESERAAYVSILMNQERWFWPN
ncbi:RagB/SusD family nutrient uptake outer membrane protein [Puteibacter caeruleilacunae]|nr:RagB/SusD family nutrient uptake outer membrane protein [Puteibacter caeruleilacunae]